jgi:zinc transport system ATP-binding protein
MIRPLVSLRDVRVRLGSTDILRGVDADLTRGAVTALIGLNGSGKSTLLRVLVREVPCTGQVRFYCGHDHSRPAPDHVGYVPQRLRFEANLPLTVADLFGLALQRRPLFFGVSRRVRARTEQLLTQVGAAHLMEAQVQTLSGGELQRVLLALALDPNPELLLLDEPASGIDFREKERFYDLIRQLNCNTGVTVLLVSHDLASVQALAQQVLCLEDGRVQAQGPPDDVLRSDVLARTFGLDRTAVTPELNLGR